MPVRRLNQLRPWAWALLTVAGVGSAVVLFFFDPSQHGFYPLCLFHRFTGLDCPGCGGLRATHQLLHGHIAEALRLNALVVLAVPVLMALAVRWIGQRLRSSRIPPKPLSVCWLWVLLAVVIAFGIVRNLSSLR